MKLSKKILIAVATCLLTAIPTKAGNNIPVDVELVLSVDSSTSIDRHEYKLQQTGYANAFRNKEVITAIENLPLGLAVTMQFWTDRVDTNMDWYHLKTKADVLAFADVLDNARRSMSGATDVDLGVRTAAESLMNNKYEGENLVIDVSGDGVSYVTKGCDIAIICPTLQNTRDEVVSQGIIINGLPILSSNPKTKWLEDKIDEHYAKNVIGGEGSFLEIANDFDDFGRAAKSKILREISPNSKVKMVAD